MTVSIDCRGLPCPEPVLRCKECLDADRPEELTVTVDNQAARENVSRFLKQRGYVVAVTERDGQSVLEATLSETTQATACAPSPSAPRAADADQKTVVFLTADTIGRGDTELGARLMANFLATLPEFGPRLWRIILVNGGVRLAVAGSPVLGRLKDLERAGVTILVCGTCLDYFGLLSQKEVGDTTNMLDVVTSLDAADKVIQL